MALIHTNITVGTTPTLLVTIPNGGGYVAVQINNRDAAPIYIGDSSIVVSTGANGGSVIAPGASLQLWMHGNDSLYAISSAGTVAGAATVIYSA
jgi:hypothetical protein